MAKPSPPTQREDFEIAIICALQSEADAVEALFDKFWDDDGKTYGKAPGDPNAYTTGVIGSHNVVLAYLPGMGKSSAASLASSLRSSFERIKLALVVGICGGVPNGNDDEKEILLGDVIISDGLIEYDFGRQLPNKRIRKDTLLDSLGRPNTEIRAILAKLKGYRSRMRLNESTLHYLAHIQQNLSDGKARYPGPDADKLFESTYRHKHHSLCAKCEKKEDEVCQIALNSLCSELKCNENKLVPRRRLLKAKESIAAQKPVIHYGLIASGDTVMKSGEDRDAIATGENIIAFEMEGAGVWDNLPCVVIKGVCDYADSHKNKEWQSYAAAAAAACMKAFLKEWVLADKSPAAATNTQSPPKPSQPVRACLQSLAFPEMYNRSNDIDTAAKGTCEWLLRHKTYTTWAACHRDLLWIKGKPGSGKSTLLRHALSHIKEAPNIGHKPLILSFFFHGRGAELQRTPLGLFRSLLHQLLNLFPDALPNLVTTFQERCDEVGEPGEKWQWHLQELQRFFESSLAKVLASCPVWLFVDALDECGKESAIKLVEGFNSLLRELPSTGFQFCICFTCRHYPILDGDSPFEICLEHENEQDISTYIRSRLSAFYIQTGSTIPALITERARGVFMWARLVVNKVLELNLEGEGLKVIEKEIYVIPQDLDELYLGLVRTMDKRPASLKLIQWICIATRPLSLDELRWAMVVDADCQHQSLQQCQSTEDYISDSDRMKRRVQTLSCGLVEITPSSDTPIVQFIHQSVKDFFVEKGLSALHASLKTTEAEADFVGIAHYRLSRTCIRYLAMEEIAQSTTRNRDDLMSAFPLLHYATTSWLEHAEQSEIRKVSQDDLLDYFRWPSEALTQLWVRVYGIIDKYSDDCPPRGTTMVHMLAYYQLMGPLQVILQKADQVSTTIGTKDNLGRTPLLIAARRGHEAVVRQLLEQGADVNTKDKRGRTPLLIATKRGYEAVVQQLLKQDANIESKDKEYGRTPLLIAAESGHEAVVQQLLKQGADINTKNKGGQTPLSLAATNGYEAVVQRLLEQAADVNTNDKEGRTPLSWAAGSGHEAVVQRLLKQDANIESKDKEYGRTPLLIAAESGHEAVVQQLLKQGADVNTKDKEGRTPLSSAAARGHKTIVQQLLEHGANIESKDDWGRTPLSWAAGRRHETFLWRLRKQGAETEHEAVVQQLLKQVANVNTKDKEGRTPLSWAAAGGHKAVVQQLLERGADINTKDKRGRTPLSWAAENGNKAVAQQLLKQGANIELKDKEYDNIQLSIAAMYGYETIVWQLLEQGADVNKKDKEGRTPLSWAAANGHEAVVLQQLKQSANIESKDKRGRTPLSWAAENGHEAVVQRLLKQGANVNTKDNKRGRTPLLIAAASGHEAVVRQLLEQGANIESKDKEGWTPLSWAAGRGYEAVVQRLLKRGTDVNTKNNKWGRTPLSYAAENGHEAIVQQLLEQGANIESKNNWSRTPLLYAAQKGHQAVVRQLLKRGADINMKDEESWTPLSWAAANGHEAVVQQLLEQGTNVESKDNWGRTPLLIAAEKGHEAVVWQLLATGKVNVNAKDKESRTPLWYATANGHEAVIRQLLEQGADINTKDKDSWTPLLIAAARGHEAVVWLLFEWGTGVNTKDKRGRTPLLYAAEHGHEAVVQQLLEQGTNIESKDKYGRTPLLYAAANGHEAVVQLLLKQGANVNIKDNWGMTPLLYAAESRREAVVQQLLEQGADVNVKDNWGRTLQLIAAENGHEAFMRQLLEQGADSNTYMFYQLTMMWSSIMAPHSLPPPLP